MVTTVTDPVLYAIQMSLQGNIALPVRGEVEHARRALADLFAFYYDCPIFSRLTKRQRRSYVRRWINKTILLIAELGFVDAINCLASYGNVLNHSLVYIDGVLTYEDTGALDGLPFLSAVGYGQQHLENHETSNGITQFGWCYNACVLLSKIPLTRPDLHEQSEKDWIKRQSQVKGSMDFRADVIEGVRLAMAYLYDDDFIEIHEGKHGPGSTSLGDKTIQEKELGFRHSIQSLEITQYHHTVSDVVDISPLDSNYIDVYKDLKSTRPITAEAINMQFSQQKLKRSMYECIEEGYVNASKFISFEDQTASQRLAVKGSKYTTSDAQPITIDLSSASDLLSVDLVIEAFSGNLLHYLLCSRTWKVKVRKEPVEVSMFAGMGSAVTFPVQTLIFTAISLMATCKALYVRDFGTKVSYAEALREYLQLGFDYGDVSKYFRHIRVYGDDIIVPKISTTEVFFLLEHLGLRVNRNKSFFGNDAVREACGVYALAGRDITPVRFRVPVWDTTADFAVYESLRQHANAAFISGHTTLYRYRVSLLKGLKPFINRDQRIRRTVSIVNTGKRVAQIRLGEPKILFEEFRGDSVDYIGVLSTRAVETDARRVFNEVHKVLTAYAPMLDTDKSYEDESYYFLQNRYVAMKREYADQFSHGRIPRGIHLVKRIAYRRSDGLGWAWVPGQG